MFLTHCHVLSYHSGVFDDGSVLISCPFSKWTCVFSYLVLKDFIYSEYKPFVGYAFANILSKSLAFSPHFIKKILVLRFNKVLNTDEYIFTFWLRKDFLSISHRNKRNKNGEVIKCI